MNILDKLDVLEEIAIDAVAIGQVSDLKDKFADVYDEIQTLEAKIKELESEREWISVEDRLPDEESKNVIVHCDGGNIQITLYAKNRFSYMNKTSYSRRHQGKQSGYFLLSHEYGYKITHWMPLPQSPKGE